MLSKISLTDTEVNNVRLLLPGMWCSLL